MSEQILAADNPFHIPSPLYRKVRPAYPTPIVEAIIGQSAPSAPPLRVADIGAGTGKMTLLLAEAGAQVAAVEPSAQMLAHMPAHERVRKVEGTGEDTTLPDASCDVVVYAQSWHWMDAEQAAAEAARITGEQGRIAIVFNQMDVSDPWVHRLSRIMRSGDVHREDQPPRLGPAWTPPTLTRVDWTDRVTPEELLELGTTRSSYLRQNQAGRERMQANLRWYLYEHLSFQPGQAIDLPYMTLLWTSGRS